MPFSSLMRDTVDILKKDGSKIDAIKASVQKDKIFIHTTALIESNDLVIRRMSNGGEETFRVIDPNFHEGHHGIPAGYQMDVLKLGLPEARSAVQNITYNVSGHGARINQNSIDNSTNVIHVDSSVTETVEQLFKEIDKLDIPEPDKAEAREIVGEVEAAFRSGSPKKSVVSALLKGLPTFASIAGLSLKVLEHFQHLP